MDSGSGVSKTPAKSGARKTTSCGECQRRKQKCDRQWPCNQCTARRRVHLCRFEAKKRKESVAAIRDNSSVLYAAATHSGRNSDDENGSPKSVDDDDEEEKPFNLAAMGFGVGASILADLKELDIIDPPKSCDTTASTALTLLCAVPPRPYTNLLVRFFLEDYNNIFFCVIHRETFMEKYAAMWNERRREKWDLNFAALLLQICAIAVQFLPEKDVPTIEELNPSRPTLSRTYVDASEKLLDLGVPGSCIERVLAHYLMSFWLKNEGRAPHGWHRLSRAVREAQELQLHIDPSEDKFTDFDAQVRRYVWMSIRTIDNHFARGLSRPRMITDSSCNVALPLPSFEGADGLDPDGPPPSPTVQPWWEHKLSRLFTDEEYAMFAEGDDGDDPQVAERFFSMAERVLNFFEKLPAFLKCKLEPGVDTHWDAQAPYLPIQRAHMLSQMNHVLSSIYRPYMRLSFSPRALSVGGSGSSSSRLSTAQREHQSLCLRLRQAGVANALALVDANRIYFENLQPHHYASAPLSFHPFEPSAQLCMFLLTEPELDPRLYERVHDAVTAVIERYTVIRTRIACGCSSERNQLGWFAVNAQMVLKALMKKVEAVHETQTSTGGSSVAKKGPTKASQLSSSQQSKTASQEHPSQTSTIEDHDHHLGEHSNLTDDSSYDYSSTDIFSKELGFNPSFDYTAEAAAAAAAVSAAAQGHGHAGDPGMEWSFDMGSNMVRSMMSPAFTFNPEDYEISL